MMVTLSHVSHRWREDILASPRLWSYVDFGNNWRAEASLQRSGKVSLDVRLFSHDSVSVMFLLYKKKVYIVLFLAQLLHRALLGSPALSRSA